MDDHLTGVRRFSESTDYKQRLDKLFKEYEQRISQNSALHHDSTTKLAHSTQSTHNTQSTSQEKLATSESSEDYHNQSDKKLTEKAARPTKYVPSTTDDHLTGVRRFWESTDYKQMSEYLRSLEESIKGYNSLDNGDHRHYWPYLTHPPPLQPLPPVTLSPAIPHNWKSHRHKHVLQTWHIIILVVIVVSAMVSYACKISSKHSSTPRSRRRGAANSSTPQQREPSLNTPARNDLSSVASVSLTATSGHAHPPLTNRQADLQEVNVHSIGFVLPEAAPAPLRPDTPPPPYPGPSTTTLSETYQKPTDPPPSYDAVMKRPT